MGQIGGILLAACALFLLNCSTATETEQLHDLFEREWAVRLQEFPAFATSVGVHDYNDRLASMTLKSLERRHHQNQEFLQELESIDSAPLSAEDQTNHSIFRIQLQSRIDSFRFKDYQIPLNADSGFQTSVARLPENVPLRTVRDYENYISRMREIPRYFQEQTALMRMGIQSGMTLPRSVLEGIEFTMDSHVVERPEESVFYVPFKAFPPAVPEGERERLRLKGRDAVSTAVIPAYRDLSAFMRNEYVPNARDTLGARELPEGADYYSFLIRQHTTLDLTADEIHNIGLEEVARIRSEMLEVMVRVGFTGEFAAFLHFLRTDPRFYAKTGEELLKEAALIAKTMDGKLPAYFKTLPRLPYTVEPVPDHLAPKYTAGRYVSAPLGGTRPGIYWVNTYALESRPLYTLPALTLHESVPGHHLQNALRQELDNLPNFRRFSGVNAYGEGWGLYSEFLGVEAGFYEDPYDYFGRLTYEMWRACRLVVDTGIHSRNWTRQQAIEYLASNTALSIHECTTETDRYISWPGQALAYKMGELKIRELRRKAEQELGTRFDIREFHDVILLTGPVPLTVLESVVDRYITSN